jgi:serine/threonine protein kinase
MGAVYKAKQLALDKMVAIKLINPHGMTEAAVRRFSIEGKATGRLNHPNLVQVWDLGVTGSGHPYLIMEYVKGKTLAETLKETPQLDTKRVQKIFRQLCLALQHAHEHDVIHRDIKPSNIMIIDSAENIDMVKIMDFGIAKFVGQEELSSLQLTKTGEPIGSPLYMSPEQARGLKNIDQRSDLYSLGCVIYEALTGLPPFVGQTAIETILMHQNNLPPVLQEASMGRRVDVSIEKVVLKLLEKNPDDRYQTAAAVLADLSDDRASGTTTGHTTRPLQNSTSAKIAATIGIVAACGALSVWSYQFFASRADSHTDAAIRHTDSRLAQDASKSDTTSRTEDAPATERQRNSRRENLESAETGGSTDSIKALCQNLNALHAGKDEKPLMLANCCLESNVSLSKSVLKQIIQNVHGFVDVQNLNLAKCEVKDEDLAPIAQMQKLRTLDLSSDLSLNSLSFLSGLKNLQELRLESANINDSSVNSICLLQNLKKLDVSRTEITPAQLLKIVESIKSLEQIKVVRCPRISESEAARIQAKHAGLIVYMPLIDKAQIQAMIASGKFNQAENIVASSYKQLNECTSPDWADMADLELLQGDIAQKKNRFVIAASFYQKGLRHLAQARPDINRTQQLKSRLAEALESQGRWREALKLRASLDELYASQNRISSSTQRQSLFINNLRRLAMDCAYLGDKEQEKSYSLKCVKNSQNYHFKNTAEYIDSLIALGHYYNTEKHDYKTATQYYEQAVKGYDAAPEMPRNPLLMQSLGQCYCALKKWPQAEQVFTSILAKDNSNEELPSIGV